MLNAILPLMASSDIQQDMVMIKYTNDHYFVYIVLLFSRTYVIEIRLDCSHRNWNKIDTFSLSDLFSFCRHLEDGILVFTKEIFITHQ